MTRFLLQVAGFGLIYALLLMATFQFMIYWGKPKPRQRVIDFLMSFPVDNEKIGAFSLVGVVAVFFLNGLVWGLVLVGAVRIGGMLRNLA